MRRFLSASIVILLAGAGASVAGTITGVDLVGALSASCNSSGGSACTPVAPFATGGAFLNKTFNSIDGNHSAAGPTTFSSSQVGTTWTGTNSDTNTGVNMVFNQSSGGNQTYLIPTTGTNGAGGGITFDLGSYNSNNSNTVANVESGVFGVNTLWTLINSVGTTSTTSTVVVTLNGYNSTGTTAISDTITLTDGYEYRGNKYSLGTYQDSAAPSCSGSACYTAASTGAITAHAGASYSDQVDVYNAVNGFSSNGYYLDGQELILGSSNPFLNGYLDSISINNNPASTVTQQMLFSGLSYQAADAAAPEPATMGILGIGLALIGGLRLRKKKNSD